MTQFTKQQYMNLETFRKTGEAMRTPVWFVELNGEFCLATEPQSGKVKRIKHNPSVRIAPCKMDGTVIGDWINGTARIMQGDEILAMNKIYSKKYGLMKALFELPGLFRKKPERVFIAIKPN